MSLTARPARICSHSTKGETEIVISFFSQVDQSRILVIVLTASILRPNLRLDVVNAFSVSRYYMREKAGLMRNAIRSNVRTSSRHKKKETGHAEEWH